MDNPQERLARLCWAAGAFDGDGTFVLAPERRKGNRLYVHPVACFYNCSPAIVDRFSAVLRENGVGHWRGVARPETATRKAQYVVRVQGLKRVKKFLTTVGSHVYGKKPQAVLMSQFIAYRESRPRRQFGDADLHLVRAMRWLNGHMPDSSETNTPGALVQRAMIESELEGKPSRGERVS